MMASVRWHFPACTSRGIVGWEARAQRWRGCRYETAAESLFPRPSEKRRADLPALQKPARPSTIRPAAVQMMAATALPIR